MVFGVPGSGKSYNEKSEMGQVLCFSKDDIIVVDPMGEYKGIAAAWGGQYINLTQSAEYDLEENYGYFETKNFTF